MCSCGGCLEQCPCGDWCCPYCSCFTEPAGCTDDCPDDCMADHRGEQ